MPFRPKPRFPVRFPKIRNDLSAPDYFASKMFFESQVLADSIWTWDAPKNVPEVTLAKELQVLHENETKLENVKKNASKKSLELQAQWDDLAEKENSLRENFLRFNSFVRENVEKRERAALKCADQRALRDKRIQDINNMKLKLKNLTTAKKNIDSSINDLMVYEKFIDEIVTLSRIEFKGANDVIKRYETLLLTRNELAMRQEKDLTDLEISRTQMIKFIELNHLKVLGLNNRINELMARYAVSRSVTVEWERIVTDVKVEVIEKLNQISKVKENTYQLYLIICERKRSESDIRKGDTENQLIFIRNSLQALEKINEALEKKKDKRAEYTKAFGSKSKLKKN